MLAVLSPIRRTRRAPPAGLASGAASPELGLWAGTQTRRIRPQPPAHVSAGEESAREPTSLTLSGHPQSQPQGVRFCKTQPGANGTWCFP